MWVDKSDTDNLNYRLNFEFLYFTIKFKQLRYYFRFCGVFPPLILNGFMHLSCILFCPFIFSCGAGIDFNAVLLHLLFGGVFA